MNSSLQNNVFWHEATVTRARREQLNGHRGVVVWLTGLSGAGKSTIAHRVEEDLHRSGCRTYTLDGDNIRHGLCSGLGFSEADRTENIRRIAEVAKLLLDGGIISLTAFISPLRNQREMVRNIVGPQNFIEVYCDCPVEVCERRDVKGLYKRARAGEVKEFTGISAPYEAPERPQLILPTDRLPLEACCRKVLDLLAARDVISPA